MREQRRERRLGVLLKAKVVFAEKFSVNCVVRDISPGGARVEFLGPVFLPSEFCLHIVAADLTIPAVAAWRHQRQAGVRFTGVATAGKVDNSPIRLIDYAA